MNIKFNKTPVSILAFLIVIVLTGAVPSVYAEGKCVIVINAANNFSADEAAMREQVKRLFLKQQTEWSNGTKAKPFDRVKGSPEHEKLLSEVLGMSEAKLASHWLSLKQKTGETAPRNVKSARSLLKLIGKYEGAFGVVDEATAASLPDGVKILFKI